MLKNKKGEALLIVLLIFSVLSILCITILGTVAANQRLSIKDRNFQEVYYIAESGVNYRMEKFKTEVMEAYNNTDNANDFYNYLQTYMGSTALNSYESVNGYSPDADVTISLDSPLHSNPSYYTIKSVGNIDDNTRTVTRKIQVKWDLDMQFTFQADMSVFSHNNIIFDPTPEISGPIGTNATGPNAIRINDDAKIGDVYLLPGADISSNNNWVTSQWTGSQHTMPEARTYDMPEFPAAFPVYMKLPDTLVGSFPVIQNGKVNIADYQSAGYTINLSQNAYIPEINIVSDYNLNINIGDDDREIVVDKINLDSGHIKVLGNGKLTIYLSNSLRLTGGSTIYNSSNPGDSSKMVIYYEGTDAIVLSGDQKIYSSFYSHYADINLLNGAGFMGHIVSNGNVTLDGGTWLNTSMLYAPNASVKLTGGAIVHGPVVSKSFYMSGGTKVLYTPSGGAIIDNPFTQRCTIDDLVSDTEPLREQ